MSTILAWLHGLSPFEEVSTADPFLRFEIRSLKYGKTFDELKTLFIRWLFIMFIPAALAWVAAISGVLSIEVKVLDILIIGVYLSFLDRLILDFAAVLAGLQSVSDDVTQGRWEVIHLTNVSLLTVIRAKYIVTQIRVWRMLVFSMCFRLTLSLLLIPTVFIEAWDLLASTGLWIKTGAVLFILASFTVLYFYIMEPRWRLRALAAGSILVSAQLYQGTQALFLAFWIIIQTFIAPVFAGAATFIAVGCMGIVFVPVSIILPFVGAFALVFVIIIVGGVVNGVYMTLTERWLAKAHQHIEAWYEA